MAKHPVSHEHLLKLLQKREDKDKHVTLEEILKTTGWTSVTFHTYLRKGQFSRYLIEESPETFIPTNSLGLTNSEFSRNLSQSKHRRELGHNCKSALAKALLKKSHENMILALELYNRPSLENRLDSFVLCFSTSWEQLLKSILIERDGEKSIYQSKRLPNGMLQTIPLRECLKRYYPKDNPIKKNLEKVIFYRDQAVHLLMPELQGIVSRIFQSGIMNYSKAFQNFSGQTLLPSSHSGMLSLIGDIEPPSRTMLLNKYGNNFGSEILRLLDETNKETSEINDIKFAIPLNVRLVFSKSDEHGNTITLSKAEDGMEGLANAIVVEKPINIQESHPYRTKEAEKGINRRLLNQYDNEYLKKYFTSPRFLRTGIPISSHDFQIICYKLKWKNSNNAKHHFHKNPDTHYYSEDAIVEFIEKVMTDPEYLDRAKESYKKRKNK